MGQGHTYDRVRAASFEDVDGSFSARNMSLFSNTTRLTPLTAMSMMKNTTVFTRAISGFMANTSDARAKHHHVRRARHESEGKNEPCMWRAPRLHGSVPYLRPNP